MSQIELLLSGPLGRTAVIVLAMGFWESMARLGYISPFFFSSPFEIGSVLRDWFAEGHVLGNVSLTVAEAFIGFVIGATAGTALAFILAFLPRVAAVLEPFVAVLNSFPRLTLAPLFIVWFGFGMEPKIVLVATFVLFVCYLNAYTGLREVPSELLDRAGLWGASRWDLIRTVYLPSATAWIFAGLRASVGFAFIGAVVGEYIGGDAGIGFLIVTGQSRLRIREVFAGIVLLLVVAVFLDFAVRHLERRLLRWRPEISSR